MAFVKEQWWHVDQEGRRIGWMWPEDMAAILESFYGARQWVNGFAEEFGFSRAQVDRWKDGHTPIPKHVAQIINMLGSMKIRGIPMAPIEASWLPKAAGARGAGAEDTG